MRTRGNLEGIRLVSCSRVSAQKRKRDFGEWCHERQRWVRWRRRGRHGVGGEGREWLGIISICVVNSVEEREADVRVCSQMR